MIRRRYLQIFCLALCSVLLLSGCGGKPAGIAPAAKFDRQWQSAMKSGLRAYQDSQYQLAGRLFSQALTRARQMDRGTDIVTAAFNLAAAQIQQGQFAEASSALQEAKSEGLRRDEDIAEILLLEAKLARWQGAADQAQMLTSQLLHQLADSDQRLQLQAQLLRGLLACEAGDEDLAVLSLEQATQSSANSEPRLVASSAELQGCIEGLRKRPQKAAEAFDRQSAALRQAHQYQQMVGALHQAGRAYHAAGDNLQAADRLYRAARSAFSQKRSLLAQQLAEEAHAAAQVVNDQPLLIRLGQLKAEMAAADKLQPAP